MCNRGQTTFIALALSGIVVCPLLPAKPFLIPIYVGAAPA